MTTPDDATGAPSPRDPGVFSAPPSIVGPDLALSDRAGDVLGVRNPSMPVAPDWMSHAISTLDAVSAQGAPSRRSGGEAPRGRRREIVDAAAALFAFRGYRGTSLRDISSKVGISHPGMLHYFKSKEALLDAVIDDLEGHAQHIIDRIESYDTTIERLEQIIIRDFTSDGQRQLLFAVLSTEAVDPAFAGRLRMIRLRRVYEHIAEHVLRSFASRGLLVRDLDLPWAARQIISLSISLSTRDATIGAVQPSSAGAAGPDFVALIRLLAG